MKWDSLNNHIISQLLLKSEIKGHIEKPGYYFTSDNKVVNEHLDLLMLTQGWRRYNLPNILQQQVPEMKIPLERGQALSGKVKPFLRKKIKGAEVVGFTDKLKAIHAKVDTSGNYVFEGIEFPDSTAFTINAVNKKGKAKGIMIYPSPEIFPDTRNLFIPNSHHFEEVEAHLRLYKETYIQNDISKEIVLDDIVVTQKYISQTGKLAGEFAAYADYVVTEAGFGADLGAEKFLDIKCRYAGIAPSACVLVATVRALKSHGGVAKADLNQPNLEAVKAGASNLVRHIDNLKNGFGLPVVVAINAFPADTPEEQAYVEQVCAEQGVPCVLSEVFAKGGEGGKALAEKVLEVMEDRPIQYVYPLEMPLKQKVEAIAKKIYRADGVNFSAAASKTLAELTELGYGDLPVCIAKTQYSFSDNAKLTGAPTGFTMEVREVRLAAGAGFVVVICGNIMTMPGLPKKPAAVNIDVDAEGKITGLF